MCVFILIIILVSIIHFYSYNYWNDLIIFVNSTFTIFLTIYLCVQIHSVFHLTLLTKLKNSSFYASYFSRHLYTLQQLYIIISKPNKKEVIKILMYVHYLYSKILYDSKVSLLSHHENKCILYKEWNVNL